MNYPLKSRPKHLHRFKTILISVVLLLLIFIAYVFPTGTRTVFFTLARPFWLGRDLVVNSTSAVGNFFVSKNNLIVRNLALEDELVSLKLKEADYDVVFKENQELKAELGRPEIKSRVLARILSKPPRSPYDTFVIDAGSSEGVSKGDKVFLTGNVIVGLVSDITSHTSVVTLFSTGGQKTETILERTGASYELSGKGGANLGLDVPKEADILWGDIFTYSGLNPATVGTVDYIDTNSQSSFKTVFLKVPGNVFQSKWVYVEKSS